MFVNTSEGLFNKDEFIQRCNEGLFPEGLEIFGGSSGLLDTVTVRDLPEGFFKSNPPESTGTPSWEVKTRWLYLSGCTSLTALPKGLTVSGYLDLTGCTSLTAMPAGIKVVGTIYVDFSFLQNYPFKDIPKILPLPFEDDKKQILLDRLANGN